jgi:hypothetical protein
MITAGQSSIQGDQAMHKRLYFLPAILVMLVGCGQSPQEKYDEAVDNYTRMQKRLDNLRPAYDAARQTAIMAVCKQITGTTPEESQIGMLKELTGVADEGATEPAADAALEVGKKKKPIGDADAAIDSLMAAEKKMGEKSAAASASVLKVSEVMSKIKTPGTPENKKLEDELAAMPEAQAYKRQEKRVEDAKEDMEDAEKDLPAGKATDTK